MEGKDLYEIIRIFLEKHLIPTVIAIAFALASYVVVPKNSIIVNALGKNLFIVFMCAIAFLFVELILYLWRVIKANRSNARMKTISNEYEKQKTEEQLDELWTFTDKLSPQDRVILKQFIASNNKPIEVNNIIYSGEDTLLGSQLVQSTVVGSNGGPIELGKNKDNFSEALLMGGKKKYRLKDTYYRILKYGYDNYGKCSHFD